MAASAAVRALIVDDDPSLIGEYRQIFSANGPAARDLGHSFDAFENDLFGAAVGHRNFPSVDIAAFLTGEAAVRAAQEANEEKRPFLVASIDSELKTGLGGL